MLIFRPLRFGNLAGEQIHEAPLVTQPDVAECVNLIPPAGRDNTAGRIHRAPFVVLTHTDKIGEGRPVVAVLAGVARAHVLACCPLRRKSQRTFRPGIVAQIGPAKDAPPVALSDKGVDLEIIVYVLLAVPVGEALFVDGVVDALRKFAA